MNYDYDLIVIGAGPAGIAAAFRARWLRTWKTFPLSVAIIDNNGLGGISTWKQVILSNPSFIFYGRELSNLLSKDFDKFPIDVIREKVVATKLNDDVKEIITNKKKYTCLGVVIATGLRHNNNERAFFGKGLIPTLKDHTYMKEFLSEQISKNIGKKFLIVGSDKVLRFWNFFNKLNNNRVKSTLFIENNKNKILELIGKNKLEKVSVLKNDKKIEIETDFLILDFESYMLKNNSTNIFNVKKEEGFITVDNFMRTNLERVYAAGDCVHGPFCTSKSIGNGVSAGFSAFKDIFIRKFNIEPSLYAFFGHSSKEINEQTGFFIPKLRGDYKPKLLRQLKESDNEIVNNFTGKISFSELKKKFDEDEIEKEIKKLAENKEVTFHV